MRLSQDSLVRGAAVVLESAWLFALMGVVGLVLGLEGSPLNWPAVLLVMGLSLVITRWAPAGVSSPEKVYLVKALIATVAVYMIIATQVAKDSGIADMLWVVRAASASAPDGLLPTALWGAIFAAGLWWRGALLAMLDRPVATLSFSFVVGLVALASAATVDSLHSADLNTLPMLFIFFAAGLGGLSLGHLISGSQESTRSGVWPRVITGVVLAVLLVGLLFSLLTNSLPGVLSVPLSLIGKGLLWAVVVPIAVVINLIMDALTSFFNNSEFAGQVQGFATPEAEFDQLPAGPVDLDQSELVEQEADETQSWDSFVDLMQVVVLGVLAVTAIAVLVVLAFRLLGAARPIQLGSSGEQESLKRGKDPVSDLARLMINLVPRWLRTGRRRPSLALPDGPAGIVEALRIYYDLLSLAERKGYSKEPHQTPAEFQQTLEVLFPRELVRMATECFDRACYGHHAATDEQIAQMRSSLRNIKSAVRLMGAGGRRLGTARP